MLLITQIITERESYVTVLMMSEYVCNMLLITLIITESESYVTVSMMSECV